MTSNLIELLRQRRSIRQFASLEVEPEKIQLLQEAALRSPTSRNFNPWRFIFVDDSALITQLAASKPHGSAFLEDAPLAVVIAAEETESDVWVEDCAIAAILIQMTAQSLGLGSCWIQIRQRPHNAQISAGDFVRRLLGAPDTIQIEAILAVGYPNEMPDPIPGDELQFEKIYRNRME